MDRRRMPWSASSAAASPFYVAVVFPGEDLSRTRFSSPRWCSPRFSRAGSRAGSRAQASTPATGGTNNARDSGTPCEWSPVAMAFWFSPRATARDGSGFGARKNHRTRPTPSLQVALGASPDGGDGADVRTAVTTVASHNRVRVQPRDRRSGRLHGFRNFASDTWFSPSSGRRPATFLVLPARSTEGRHVSPATATATFQVPRSVRVSVRHRSLLRWKSARASCRQ